MCTATNRWGTADSSGKLIVLRGPSFTGSRIAKPKPRPTAIIGTELAVTLYVNYGDKKLKILPFV